mmetsp:Transcript_1408/g.2567  ORF Transcript_1408/g.2567 Transcript_1408/m.2567 type:complete len:518 (+) Transcript_1408:120-1673(+)|eukprot:CAMPEP_0176500868 /NCGR_PEP_ID=MMETSP0200_2-20121128/13828_1 /TAXON_ID=947934 /ORGANISM="Chaetoceros sp., Strain GSL56" /LENGTH=517 /DNA_ID=CAMNT_0017899659 /DNA_START=119 /DNA_END=1672 /DNA_ORIENTATION=-
MNRPKVLIAGGAGSTSLTSSKRSLASSSSPSVSSSSADNNNQSSPDRAAGSVPSSPVKTESKLNEPIPSLIHNALSEGLSSQSSNADIESLSYYDNDEPYGDGYESEEQSETRGLILDDQKDQRRLDDLYTPPENNDVNSPPSYHQEDSSLNSRGKIIWLAICFFGIMLSFVGYGLLLEYATSGGRKLHELSFLFVTSLLYTVTAAAGRYVRDETPTTIPPARFAVLGLTSMGSTFCSVRSLRYVIFPIQVLAKSCKPVPVMLMGAFMGKKYPLKKYINVFLIVAGVGLFMGGGGSSSKKSSGGGDNDHSSSGGQIIGVLLLFISLCFDGGTGAYEDKLMAVHSVGPFDLMYNIQLGKTIIAGVSLLVLNQIHVFFQMCQEMGFVLVALGLTGALGQVFIFVTISKFGALTCSIIGLARKVTTLVASIYFYGHHLNAVQMSGLVISVASMVMNFMGKKKGGGGGGHGHGGAGEDSKKHAQSDVKIKYRDNVEGGETLSKDIEMKPINKVKPITAGGC